MGAEKEPRYYEDLVRNSPKVLYEDQTDWERKNGHYQYGNNFYLLFLALQRYRENPQEPDNVLVEVYLNRAEELGDKWFNFLASNENLIGEIFEASNNRNIYSDLLGYIMKLMGEHREDRDFTEAFNFADLGVEEIGIYYWRILNPLLEEAARQMEKCGIDPTEFFG